MISDIDSFLRWFDSVHRRALRDVGALPLEAERWSPATLRQAQGERGENAWGIGEIVRHIAGTRIYFARAYRGEGWIADWPPPITESQSSWLPALEASAAEFRSRIEGTPDEWLTRKVPLIDSEGTISGWRILMMMVEHEIHHRSQIDTYAGLNGWEPPHIYGRSAEQVGLARDRQRELHGEG
ncbi:MAG: DinB family protein [Dehalococcoidia bacterium]|nr:DinB family protein [Dehalococcoidia bacterium]